MTMRKQLIFVTGCVLVSSLCEFNEQTSYEERVPVNLKKKIQDLQEISKTKISPDKRKQVDGELKMLFQFCTNCIKYDCGDCDIEI